MSTAHRIKLLPKQDKLIFSNERHTMYSGAVGAGKSLALSVDILLHCEGRPETRYGLFRKTRKALVMSTLKTLLVGDGHNPPILPYGTYRHNKNEGEIQLAGGGLVIYSGVETPEAVRSMNLTRAGIDEVTELTAEDYNAIDDRVRVPIGQPLRILSATNPGTPSHWLAKMHGLSPDKQTPDRNSRVIMTKTSDNIHLPPEYIEGFERHIGTLYYRRMFLGEWCGSDGLVYDRWDRGVHVLERSFEPTTSILGVDDGYTDPFTVIRHDFDNDGRAHIPREVYETGMLEPEKIEAVRSMLHHKDDEVIVDSAAAALIASMRAAGINAKPCQKGQDSIEYGVNLVQSRLAVQGDGMPRLTVDPSCVNTIREFESYERKPLWDGFGDKFIDRDNHAMDPIRYVCRHVEKRGGLYFPGMNNPSPEPEPVEREQSVWDRMSTGDRGGWDKW